MPWVSLVALAAAVVLAGPALAGASGLGATLLHPAEGDLAEGRVVEMVPAAVAPAGPTAEAVVGQVTEVAASAADAALATAEEAAAGLDGIVEDTLAARPEATEGGDGPSSSAGAAPAGLPTPVEVARASATAVAVAAMAALLHVLGVAPWVATFSRIEGPALAQHPTRRQALDHLAANPGATLQEVRHALGVAWGTAVHHLARLERSGLVAVRRDGGLRRHWLAGQAPPRDALPWSDRALATLVGERPGLAQAELARLAGIGAPSACKRLAALEARGMVTAVRAGRQRLYLPTASLGAALATRVS